MAEKKENCHMLITSPLNEGGFDKNLKDIVYKLPEVMLSDHMATNSRAQYA